MRVRIKNFNECFEKLWEQYQLLIILLMCAFLFDTLSTIHFMTTEGVHLELHPLIRYSAMILGPITGTILSAFMYKIVTCIFLAMYLRQLRLLVLILPAVMATFAGFYNLLTC